MKRLVLSLAVVLTPLFLFIPRAFATTTIPYIATNLPAPSYYLIPDGTYADISTYSVVDQFTGSSYEGAWAFYNAGSGYEYTGDSCGSSTWWWCDDNGGTEGIYSKFGIACNPNHPGSGSFSLYSYAAGDYATFVKLPNNVYAPYFNSTVPAYNMASTALCG